MTETASPGRVLFCSYAAATGALIINFPLDTVKTRIQATSQSESVARTIQTLYKEGGIPAFYRGISASLISSSAARAMSMSLYASFIPKYARLFGSQMQSAADRPLLPVFFSGLTAGAFSCVLTGPFEFTKTASQVESLIRKQSAAPNHMSPVVPITLHQDSLSIGAGRSGLVSGSAAPSMPSGALPQETPKISALRAVNNIWRKGGFRELYGGVEYHCIRDSVGSAIYFTVYEVFKKGLSRNHGPNDPPSPIAVAVAGAMCGMASWLAVYPIDTMKSEYQRDLYSHTLMSSEKGVQRPKFRFSLKMYRGLGFSLMRTSLNGVCLFSFFEYLMWMSS